VDARYSGQSHAINLAWHGLHNIAEHFHQKHEDSYGHRLDMEIELVNIRVRVIEKRQSFEVPKWRTTKKTKAKFIRLPNIEKSVVVINRNSLTVNQKISGPALIIETSSTTWLAEDWAVLVDEIGNLRLEKI
jgi:N-methylhydantoinase A